MLITGKAAVGFLLLAVIVFLTAQGTVNQTSFFQQPHKNYEIRTEGVPLINTYSESLTYKPPAITFGSNAPLIFTAIIELFTLSCYLVLKKLEPAINKAAENSIRKLRGN